MDDMICTSLVSLFQSSTLNVFDFDADKNIIYIKSEYKDRKETHADIFMELQIITQKLIELDCDYSLADNGDIFINCHHADCSVKP